LPPIEADPDMLYKVFYNVIINAIKYTPDGGQITVGGQVVDDVPSGKYIQIRVRDTGIGIDAKHHGLIFEKLYQVGEVALHSSGKTKFKGGGPGLGLAIAKGIVEAHGGRIWVESPGYDEESCPGSTFYILLPVAGPQEQ
jgi:signal transduction histidine kinase